MDVSLRFAHCEGRSAASPSTPKEGGSEGPRPSAPEYRRRRRRVRTRSTSFPSKSAEKARRAAEPGYAARITDADGARDHPFAAVMHRLAAAAYTSMRVGVVMGFRSELFQRVGGFVLVVSPGCEALTRLFPPLSWSELCISRRVCSGRPLRFLTGSRESGRLRTAPSERARTYSPSCSSSARMTASRSTSVTSS
jgi:hypothetical protein